MLVRTLVKDIMEGKDKKKKELVEWIARDSRYKLFNVTDRVFMEDYRNLNYIDNDSLEAKLITLYQYKDDIIYENGEEAFEINVICALLNIEKYYAKLDNGILGKLSQFKYKKVFKGEHGGLLNKLLVNKNIIENCEIKDGLVMKKAFRKEYEEDIKRLMKYSERFNYTLEDRLLYRLYWSDPISYVIQNMYTQLKKGETGNVIGLETKSDDDELDHDFIVASHMEMLGELPYKDGKIVSSIIIEKMISIIEDSNVDKTVVKPKIPLWLFKGYHKDDTVTTIKRLIRDYRYGDKKEALSLMGKLGENPTGNQLLNMLLKIISIFIEVNTNNRTGEINMDDFINMKDYV